MVNRTPLVKPLVLAAVAGAFGMASTAKAAFILKFEDGNPGDTVTIFDNGAGDLDSDPGAIVYTGAVGAFSVNLTTAFSNAAAGTNPAILQISSLDIRNGTAGAQTLTISLTDTGFTAPSGAVTLRSAIGGTTTGIKPGDSLAFQSYYDPTDAAFGTTDTTGPQAFTFTNPNPAISFGGAASDKSADFINGSTPFSITNVASFSISANSQLNLSGTTSVVPEPATLGLLGMGGIALLARRRR